MSVETKLRPLVEAAYRDRNLLSHLAHREAILGTIENLDRGALRVATKESDGAWLVHAWVKEAILLYFAIREMQVLEVGPFEFHDKIPLKCDLAAAGVRVVPPGTVRYGAFLEPTAIVM